MVLPLCPDTKTTVRDLVSMPAQTGINELNGEACGPSWVWLTHPHSPLSLISQITWQLLSWMMHANRSGYRLRVSTLVPPSCSVQEAFCSPHMVLSGASHLALEGMETLLPWLPQGHQLDTSLGDKTTGSV